MASVTVASLSDYLHSSFEPDAEYADGHIEERPMGERDHSDLQLQMLLLLNQPANRTFFFAPQTPRTNQGPELPHPGRLRPQGRRPT